MILPLALAIVQGLAGLHLQPAAFAAMGVYILAAIRAHGP